MASERVEDFVKDRRMHDRSINTHIVANPAQSGVRDHSETVSDLLRDHESPAIEIGSLGDWPTIPCGASLLIEMPEEAWKDPASHFEEWEEIRKTLAASRSRQCFPVIVSGDVPTHVENILDLRIRISDGKLTWYRIQRDTHSSDIYEVELDD